MNDKVYFNNTQFWTEQWKAYDAGISAYRGYSNASTWNSMAAEYDKERHSRNMDERIDATFARLQNRGFECKGCHILDIGCGPGGIPVNLPEEVQMLSVLTFQII